MAGAATDDQAVSMVTTWLLNPKHFCIAPNGDFENNTNDCYWGLPYSNSTLSPALPNLNPNSNHPLAQSKHPTLPSPHLVTGVAMFGDPWVNSHIGVCRY